MQHLALQVGRLHDVEVDKADAADARRREVQRDRRAEAAGPDHQGGRVEQPPLPLVADLGEQQVACVAIPLLRGEAGCGWSVPARAPAAGRRRHRRRADLRDTGQAGIDRHGVLSARCACS